MCLRDGHPQTPASPPRCGFSPALIGSAALLLAAACSGAKTPAPPLEIQVLSAVLPAQFDPYVDSRVGAISVFGNVFEPLVRLGETRRVVPVIAESWTNPAPDICEFRLRAGVRFHDGVALQAEDVVRSIEVARARPQVAGQLSEITAVEAIGLDLVRFRTRVALDTFVYLLTAVPVARSTESGVLVGTGPFELGEFHPRALVRLRRFSGYHGPAPIVEAATFRTFASAEEAQGLLIGGLPSVVISPPRELIDQVRHDERFRVVSRPGGAVYHLAFNLARDGTGGMKAPRNPFLDVQVRRAARAALDLERLVSEAAPAGGTPASQFVPPRGFGFDPLLVAPTRDLAEARRLLAVAGYPSGFETTLDVSTADRLLGLEISRQLQAAGIRAAANVLPGEAFRARIDGGASTLFVFNWVVGRGSGAGFMSFLHTRDEQRRRGLRNRTGYSNRTLDAALEAVTREPADSPNRASMQRGIMRLLMEDLPWLPLYVDNTARIYSRGLEFPWWEDGMLRLWEARLARPGMTASPGPRE